VNAHTEVDVVEDRRSRSEPGRQACDDSVGKPHPFQIRVMVYALSIDVEAGFHHDGIAINAGAGREIAGNRSELKGEIAKRSSREVDASM